MPNLEFLRMVSAHLCTAILYLLFVFRNITVVSNFPVALCVISCGGTIRYSLIYQENNRLIGSIPAFSEMSKLTTGIFIDNMLTNTIPPSLTALPNLRLLRLQGNLLTGQVPPFNPQNENLEGVDLYDNDLSGRLEDWLVSLNSKRLSYIWASKNRFTGTLPSFIGTFTSLWFFSLGDNGINGSIPTQIGEMTSLQRIELPRCDIGGAIPTEIGKATLVVSMHLGNNDLAGTIPTEIGGMRALTWLTLENNLLSGTIPSGLGNLSKLGKSVDCSIACLLLCLWYMSKSANDVRCASSCCFHLHVCLFICLLVM
jgi:Leucine-rich repeat (LRR) protein